MDQVEIGKFIKSMRRSKSLTQRQVANRLNISEKTVSKWETGCGLPEVGLMLPLCKLLGVTLDELFSCEKLGERQYHAGDLHKPQCKEKIYFRHFECSEADLSVLKNFYCPELSIKAVSAMIDEWNTLNYNGKYFEMFAVMAGERTVGSVSLYEHSKSVVSIGPQMFEKNCGFAKAAMLIAIDVCKNKEYKIVCQQVREDNEPSKKLHTSLGFETDNYVYKNRRSQDVILYILSI